MVKITQDLSSLVGSLSDTKKELQEILSVFNSLSAAASNLGGTINSAFGQGSLSSSQVSSRGSSVVVGDFNEAIKKAQADIINKPQNVGQIFDLQGQLVSNAINKPITNAPTGGTDPLGSLSQRLINQYGAKDLPRMLNQADTATNLSTNLSNRAATLAQGTMEQRALSNVIKELENTLSTRQKEFTEVYRQFAAAQTSGDVVKTAEVMESLKKAMAAFTKAVEEATDANKELAKKDGDGSGGGGGGFFERNTGRFGRGLTIAGAAMTGYAEFQNTAVAFQGAIQNSQSNYWNTTHGAQGILARQQIGAFDMTDPGNILRHKGDVLFGAQFLGESGLKRADAIARKEEAIRIDQLRRERESGIFGALGSGLATGGAALLAGKGLAALGLGVGGAIAGVPLSVLAAGAAIGYGGYRAVKSYMGSEYTGMQGGMATGIGGMFSDFLGMKDQAAFRQPELLGQSQLNIISARERLRDLEEQAMAPQKMALTEIRQMYDARRAGLSMVGGRVLSINAAMGLSGASLNNRRAGEQNLQFKEQTDRANLKQNLLDSAAGIDITGPIDHMDAGSVAYRRGLIEARKSTLNKANAIDGQITAIDSPLVRGNKDIAAGAAQTTTLSQLLVSPAEFITKAAQTLNAFGPGGVSQDRNISATSGLIRMGYGGFGNFEQLTGNIAAMSRVTGDSDSLEKLKNVLASAVAIGFNNSRLAQEFVRTTTELSQGLGITNTNYTSGLLAGGTGALAGMGIGGEMGLSIMAKGLSNYAQVTNSGGIYGAAKMIGMFSGGGRIGEAGAIIQSMSAPELSAGLDELSTGDIKSPKVLAMLQNIQSGRSGITRKQAIEMLQQQMSGGRTGVTSPIRAIMDMITKSQSDSEFDKKTPEEKTRILLSRGGEAGAAMPGLGFEGGIAAMAEQLSEMPGYLRGRAMEKYKAQVLKGSEAAQADKALAMRRRYSDSILRQTGNMMAGVSTGEYADEYKKGARMHFDDGTEIDPSKFNDPAYFEKAQKTLSGKSQFDLRMETAASLPDTDGVQPVRIMNASELGAAVLGGILARESVKETNLNKQDESPAPGMLGPP